jgi:hypothetical protein
MREKSLENRWFWLKIDHFRSRDWEWMNSSREVKGERPETVGISAAW